jgi:hypothetical protein
MKKIPLHAIYAFVFLIGLILILIKLLNNNG